MTAFLAGLTLGFLAALFAFCWTAAAYELDHNADVTLKNKAFNNLPPQQ